MTPEEKKALKAANDLKKLFFDQLDAIYNTCETAAKEYNSTAVPLKFIELTIKSTKKGFNKGFKKG